MIGTHPRRRLVVAVLIGLLAAFSAGAVIHHLADHAAAGAGETHHGNDGRGALVATGAVAGSLALMLIGMLGRVAAQTPAPAVARRRHHHPARAGAPPGRFVPRRLRRAELQCFLT